MNPDLTKICRRVLWLEFEHEPQLKESLIEQIACVIMDFDKERTRDHIVTIPPLTQNQREVLATRIFEHLFKEE